MKYKRNILGWILCCAHGILCASTTGYTSLLSLKDTLATLVDIDAQARYVCQRDSRYSEIMQNLSLSLSRVQSLLDQKKITPEDALVRDEFLHLCHKLVGVVNRSKILERRHLRVLRENLAEFRQRIACVSQTSSYNRSEHTHAYDELAISFDGLIRYVLDEHIVTPRNIKQHLSNLLDIGKRHKPIVILSSVVTVIMAVSIGLYVKHRKDMNQDVIMNNDHSELQELFSTETRKNFGDFIKAMQHLGYTITGDFYDDLEGYFSNNTADPLSYKRRTLQQLKTYHSVYDFLQYLISHANGIDGNRKRELKKIVEESSKKGLGVDKAFGEIMYKLVFTQPAGTFLANDQDNTRKNNDLLIEYFRDGSDVPDNTHHIVYTMRDQSDEARYPCASISISLGRKPQSLQLNINENNKVDGTDVVAFIFEKQEIEGLMLRLCGDRLQALGRLQDPYQLR